MLGALAVAMALGVVGIVLGRAPVTHADHGSGQPPQNVSKATVPDEVLVKFTRSTPKTERHTAHEAAHADAVKSIDALDTELVHVRPGTTVEQAIAAYKGRGDVVYAEPNGKVKALMTPNDPMYGDQWALPKISAPAAWDTTTGAGVTIAVLDTGVDLNHPEFAGRIIPGINTATSGGDLMDDDNHGTSVAGIAAAAGNNSVGVAGVCWQCNIMVVKVMENGSGSDFSVAAGITYATDHGARVINLSLGGGDSPLLQSAVQYALNHNVVVVAAAGNYNTNGSECPACYSDLGVISVAATEPNDTKAGFSDYGPSITIAAPGDVVLTTTETYPPANQQPYCCYYGYPPGYWFEGGTSMATPFVSGAAALVIAAHPTWTNKQVRDALVATADPINSPYFSAGRLNVAAALGSAPSPTASPTPPIGSASPTPTPAGSAADTTPPSVTISQPSSGATVPAGKTVAITAAAADNVAVKKVEFYLNGVLKCTDTSAPYSCNWGVSRTQGITYTLEARAYDAAGNRASQSNSVVSGLDTTPPTVGITSPASTTAIVVPAGANVTLSASGADDVGVTKVEFWVNGSRKCSDNAAPYTCSWKAPTTPGITYTIEARAYDASGNVSKKSLTAVSQ